MSDITVVGLGLMGAALARAIQRAGHELTVWNRSPEKMQPFIDDGVATAPDAASAIMASGVVLICIDNYAVTDAIVKSEKIAPLLAGRTVVQLSTGTPLEARDAGEWMKAHDVWYLDGAILAGPNDIGTESGQILLSGDEEAYTQVGTLLDCLGGNVRYLGTNPRAATVLDLAWLCESYGRFLAVTHAARLCESEDVSVGDFASLFEKDSATQCHANTIHSGDFENCTATLQVWRAALKHIQTQGKDAGINTEFPDYVDGLFEKAVEAGYGEQHVMALVKVLR
ncbi:MAG: NAD(P)-binding domain-containing protein [Rhodothermia bacterium]|nr:MAG: NAD(P)-binding domain-containing protein [Rhodothermia bacterium]